MTAVADGPAVTTTPAGPWRALARGWPVFVPVIVLGAGVQALLVRSDPVPDAGASFLFLVLVSLLAVLAAVWLTVGAASAAVDGERLLSRVGRRPMIVVWALGVGVVAAAVSLLELWATPLVLVLGAPLLPAAAAPDPGSVVARAYRPVARTPVRWVLVLLLAVVLAALTWALALGFGFFVTGALGALATWLWFGIVSTFLIAVWCALYRRATPAPG